MVTAETDTLKKKLSTCDELLFKMELINKKEMIKPREANLIIVY